MNTEQLYLRQTAKFSSRTFPISTSSKIIIPAGKHHLCNQRRIQWHRIYSNIREKLYNMEDLLYYQCSPLDYDCHLEAIIEYPVNGIVHCEKFQYGPAKIDNNSGFKIQQYFGYPVHALSLLEGRSHRDIQLYFDNGVIITAQGSYSLSFQEICSIYTQSIKQATIIIGTISQRLFAQKVHLDGYWTQYNLQPIRIKFHSIENFLCCLYTINRVKYNINQQNINQYSIKYHQRNHPNVESSCNLRTTFQKISNQSTDILNISGYQNQQIAKRSLAIHKNQKRIYKNSQLLKTSQMTHNIRNSNVLSSDNNYAVSVKGECFQQNFIDQFDNLFKDDKEEEELCLNDSFEEFQKKSKDQKQIEKLLEIQKKKQKRKNMADEKNTIIQKIQKLNAQNLRLASANYKLSRDLEILKINAQTKPSVNELQAIVNSMKRYEKRLNQDLISFGSRDRSYQFNLNQNSFSISEASNVIYSKSINQDFHQ